jgi:site-specific DNA recombinase
MIATRIAESRAYLKKHGRRLAGPPPFGYDIDRATKQLVANKIEARRVRAIFKRAAAGELPKQIAFACNKQGWTTKVYLSKRSGKTIGGGRWTARQIVAMLRNPVYAGRFSDGTESRSGSHQAIIDPEVFQAAQNALACRRTTEPPRQARQSQNFLFRKKVVCPRCGRLLTTYSITKKTGPQSGLIYRYYSCRSTAGGRARCKGVQYPAVELERAVGDMLLEPDVWRKLMGDRASEEKVARAVDTWTVIPWLWRTRFLDRYVQRIELRPRKSELAVTFDPNFQEAFSADLLAFPDLPVN